MPKDQSSLEWLKDRSAGILLHPTSLPDPNGVGCLGPAAYSLLNWMKEASLKYWQILPLGPTGYGDSPYQSFSAFAGNPYLIDLQPLCDSGILTLDDLKALRSLPEDKVDFSTLFKCKLPILRLAYRRFKEGKRAYLVNYGMFDEFCKNNAEWLEPYIGFMALKESFGGAFWGEWPEEFQSLESARKQPRWKELSDSRSAFAFFQYLFFGQWGQVKQHANNLGIKIIGDMPIFVSLDSADVWANPELFQMEGSGNPSAVAGVPPDYFSETGQLWGNPLYDWEHHQSSNFSWWKKRFETNFQLCDVVRVDHFRGFYNYWRIPAEAEDARSGEWVFAPGEALFNAIAETFPDAAIIAEDLGEIDDGVRALRDQFGLPGMTILQFAFGGSPDNLYLPHHLEKNAVVYPGTHDNNTTRGWYENAPEHEKDYFRRYFRVSGDDASWDFIRAAYASASRLAIIPAQDLLSLDATARMNIPGYEQGNWQWRLSPNQLEELNNHTSYLSEIAKVYYRKS